jgi:L-fuculose-phosphate aldolase
MSITGHERDATTRFTVDETDIRFRIAAARRILFRNGCDSGTAGHVSVRADGEDAFYVTPFQSFAETLPEHVVKVSFALQTIEGDQTVSPAVAFHAAIYQSRADVRSVIHHHGHYVSLMATTGQIIGQYNIASSLFFEEQALTDDDDSGSAVDSERLPAALGDDKHVVLIKNHGCVVVGGSLEEATVKALTLEQSARYHFEALLIGGTELSKRHALEYKYNFNLYYVPEMWGAEFRKLRKSDPDLYELSSNP